MTRSHFATRLRPATHLLRGALVLLLAACGDPPLSPDDPATISISLAPSSATVVQGGSTTVTGTAVVGGSFSGAVDFTVTGLPAGVTIGVGGVDSPSAGRYTTQITVDVGSGVAAGAYSGTVTASGSGVSDEAAYTLTVTEPAAGGFSLGAVSSASVQQGGSVMRTVDITRTGGFTGDVTISIEGLPSDVTATAAPETTSSGSSTVTIDVGGSAATGSSTVTLRGTAAGLPDATTTMTLTVTAPSASVDLTFDYSSCTLDEQPVWVAVQDGARSGSWTRVMSVSGSDGVYEFSVDQTTFGITAVTQPPGETEIAVGYYGVGQLDDLVVDVCPAPSAKSVNGTAAGVVGFTNVSLGGVGTPLFADGPFSLGSVPEGVLDLVGYSFNLSGGDDRMVVMRDLDVPNGGSVGTIDFGAGVIPASATMTVSGLTGGESGFAGMEYATSSAGASCSVAPLYSGILPGSGTFTGKSAPGGTQMADEFHVASITASIGTDFKGVKEAFSTLANRTIAMPAGLATPTVTDVTGGNYLRLRAQHQLPAEYTNLTSFGYSVGPNLIGIFAVGDAMTQDVDLELPDYSAVDGWDDAWGIATGTTGVDYLITATGLTTLDALCTEGGRQVQANRTGDYN